MWVFFFNFSWLILGVYIWIIKLYFLWCFFFLVDDESEENVDRDFVGCD